MAEYDNIARTVTANDIVILIEEGQVILVFLSLQTKGTVSHLHFLYRKPKGTVSPLHSLTCKPKGTVSPLHSLTCKPSVE